MTEKMLGYCGYHCHACAARSDDPAVRQKLVDGWRKYLGYDHYTVDNVRCDGCRADGRLADTQCQARPCAQARGVSSCALCDEFPCTKVRGLLASRDYLVVLTLPHSAQLTAKEYELCLAQFDSLPTLVQIMVEAGRLPDWLEE